MKIFFTICLLIYCFNLFAQNANEQSRTGKVPPAGIDVIGHVSDLKNVTSQQIIPGVPCYIWHHGCGPTSVGMVVGYYALNGFPALISGNASTQTSIVNTVIASTENYNDYCSPEDRYPNLLSDLSELPVGDEHTNNCIADFMKTSQSYLGNYYGWSWSSDIKPSWENYINYASVGYNGFCTSYYFGSFPWDSLVNNVNNNRPMVFLVDTDGDGVTDHFVCVNGYKTDLGTNYYGCYNTWDANQHWYAYEQIANGTLWGVSKCYTFKINYANGIDLNEQNNNSLNYFPNPANNFIKISFNYLTTNTYKIVILNSLGKQVYLNNNLYDGDLKINTYAINDGLYFVQLFCNNNLIESKKIIITK